MAWGIESTLSMPQYELMYLLGSHVADTDIPQISEQIQKFVSDFGGTDIVENQLGKKKLAYPIKKTRNGNYVTVNFTMDTKKINDLDAKIRTQDQVIIRYLLINLDEHLERTAKDQVTASKMVRRQPEVTAETKPETAGETPASQPSAPLVEIDQEELDKKIEAALSEDLTK
jgi:small subunit ribosomal protein S6